MRGSIRKRKNAAKVERVRAKNLRGSSIDLIYTEAEIGKGHSCSVHAAKISCNKQGSLIPLSKRERLVAKNYTDDADADAILEEARLLSRFFRTDILYVGQSFKTATERYLVTEQLGRQNLSDLLENDNEASQLSYREKISIVTHVMYMLFIMHQRNATVHMDVNPANIRIDTRNSTATLVDHGSVQSLDQGGQAELTAKSSYTVSTAAPEVHAAHRAYNTAAVTARTLSSDAGSSAPSSTNTSITARSDIYSFAKSFEEFLAPDDEDTSKDPDPCDELYKKYHIQTLQQQFMQRMLAENAEDRPDDLAALRFFTTLDLFCRTAEHNPTDVRNLNMYAAKLNILAAGLWNDTIGEKIIRNIFQSNNSKKSGKPTFTYQRPARFIDATFEDIDFESEPALCKAILTAANNNDSHDEPFVSNVSQALKAHGLFSNNAEALKAKPLPVPTR